MTLDALRLPILALLTCAACQPLPPPANLHLSAVEYWPEGRLLFVAVPRSGAVDVLRVPEDPRQGSLDFVERLAETGRRDVVRLAVDRVHRRLWVAESRGVDVYPLAPRGPATRVSHGPPLTPPVSDLIIDPEGNGYLFMAGGERIDRVSAATLRPEHWLGIGHAGPRTSRTVAERGVITKDGRQAYLRSPEDGSLLRIDLATRKVVKVERREVEGLDCATLMLGDTDAIAAIPCRGQAIVQVPLEADLTREARSQLPPPI